MIKIIGLVLALDPWHEKTHRQIMRAHLEQGNRPQAIAQYNKLRAALRNDLGVEPDPATMMLYEQIRADTAPGRRWARIMGQNGRYQSTISPPPSRRSSGAKRNLIT